jgi:hypothetical protein
LQAAENGYLQLVHAAQVERQHLPKFTVPKSFNSALLSVDHKAAAILNRCGVKNVGTPYQVFSNGGCLFDCLGVINWLTTTFIGTSCSYMFRNDKY